LDKSARGLVNPALNGLINLPYSEVLTPIKNINEDVISNINEKMVEDKVQDFKLKMEKVEKVAANKKENLDENIQDVILRKTENPGYRPPMSSDNIIPTETSKVSDLSISKQIKVMNNDSIADYTNEYRSNPGESFYEGNIEEFNKMQHENNVEKIAEMTKDRQDAGGIFKINMKKVNDPNFSNIPNNPFVFGANSNENVKIGKNASANVE